MKPKIYYLFDPLCGWCYGASPAIHQIATQYPLSLTPTGLFFRSGRIMDAEFARYAWSNDQRIEQLTKQPFSQAYWQNILCQQGYFDSENSLLALTAVQQIAPEKELTLLTALQHARYVDGLDNADMNIIQNILRQQGLTDAIALLNTANNQSKLLKRIQFGQQLAKQLHIQGVPQLIVEKNAQWHIAPSSLLYNPQNTQFYDWLAGVMA